MGALADYVLIEGGNTHIFSSYWGANHIDTDLLAGPDVVKALVQSSQPAPSLHSWEAGGILLDWDRRHLIFWSFQTLCTHASLRRCFLRGLRRIWEGWQVEWAKQGVSDFGRYLHIDVRRPSDIPDWTTARNLADSWEALLVPHDQWEAYWSESFDLLTDLSWTDGLVVFLTVRWEDERVADYALMCPTYDSLYYLLKEGVAGLDFLRNKPSYSLPPEDNILVYLDAGAYVDLPVKALWIWESYVFSPGYLRFLEDRWPNFRVQGHADGLVGQVQLSGRDHTSIAVSDEDAFNNLLTLYTRRTTFNPAKALLNQARLAPPGSTIQVSSGFLSIHPSPLSLDECVQIIKQWFQ